MKSETTGNQGTPFSSGAPEPLTMMECVACCEMAFTLVVYPEAEALFADGTISRYCKVCGKRTRWRRMVLVPGTDRN